MAPPKKITGYVKLQIEAAKATPAPPVGPALGQAQVNIMEFCKQFNARTQLQLYHQDASGGGSAEEGGRHRQGLGHAEQGKDRQGDGKPSARDRHAEDAGFERRLGGDGDQEHQGHGAVDGD